MKLVIISHTRHFSAEDGSIVGWGPTVREINYLASQFEKVYHVAFLYQNDAPNSALPYTQENIEFIGMPPVGGSSFQDKIKMILAIPSILNTVKKTLKKGDVFQFRAPTGIGVFLIPYLTFFVKKRGWYKYAGNWQQERPPIAYAWQRFLLRKQSRQVTINGDWPSEREHIISFENPCLTEKERNVGATVISNKTFQKPIHFCFVGSLHHGKGIMQAIKAWKNTTHKEKGVFHILGGGLLENEVRRYAENDASIKWYGYASKETVNEVMIKSHFILLPSESEGFPKVIGEAMNYGCIPIVTNVSCVGQYVKNEANGFLLASNEPNEIATKIVASFAMTEASFSSFTTYNYRLASKFTYEYYTKRIENDIIKEK